MKSLKEMVKKALFGEVQTGTLKVNIDEANKPVYPCPVNPSVGRLWLDGYTWKKWNGTEWVKATDYHTPYSGDQMVEDAKKLTAMMKMNGLLLRLTAKTCVNEFYNPMSDLKEIFELCKQGYVSQEDMNALLDCADKHIEHFKK